MDGLNPDGVVAIDPVSAHCAHISPALDAGTRFMDGFEVRFECQKALGHSGKHQITLGWPDEPQLLAEPPWLGVS